MVQTVSGGEKEIDVGSDTGVKEQMEIAEMQLSSNRGAEFYQSTLKCHSPATTKRGGVSHARHATNKCTMFFLWYIRRWVQLIESLIHIY